VGPEAEPARTTESAVKTAAVVYEFPCVSETFVLSQITGLAELGCDMRIFADNADVAARGAGLPEVFPIDRVSYFGLPFKNLRESVGRRKSKAGAAVSAPRRQILPNVRLKLESRAFSKHSRFDVIHAHFGPNGVRSSRLREMGVISGALITSFYGYDVGRRWALGGYDRLFASGERFLALSEHMREALINLGCPSERIIVHRLGVDLDRFRTTRRTVNGSTFEVISVARLIPKKGIGIAIKAIATLAEAGVPVRYTVVGAGPLREDLKRLALDLGIEDLVNFVGPKSPDVVAALLSNADVLAAPSVTAADGDAEGTPVAILEAGASGLPVVATRHAGIPEVVTDGETGFLVAEEGVTELADRLLALWESPQARKSMGEAGRQIVAERHEIKKLNQQLLRIYQEAVG